jgi:hypothetical protein
MPPDTHVVLHFKTQAGQPYGSESRKCSRCGRALLSSADGVWTDVADVWADPPLGYVQCRVEGATYG